MKYQIWEFEKIYITYSHSKKLHKFKMIKDQEILKSVFADFEQKILHQK